MKNTLTKVMPGNVSVSDLSGFIKDNGKYGCFAFGMILVYALVDKAIDKNCDIECKCTKEDGFSFSVKQPSVQS